MEVREIAGTSTHNLILNNHYARRIPQIVYSFGLYEDDELVGCVTYGRPSTPQVAKSVYPENTKLVYELNRLVVITDKKNAASYLVGNSLKKLDVGLVIVSYADGAFGHVGYVYQATNFYYAGLVKAHDSEYIWNGKKYHPRVLNHMGINNPVQWSKEVGAKKLPIIAKHRYVYITGKKQNDIFKNINWKLSKDYPKGDTKRHEQATKVNVIQQMKLSL